MKASDYIDFAAKIAVTYSDASSCRSAISRAYYGAFHMTKSLLAQLGFNAPRNANVHVFIQHRLANCGYVPVAEVGIQLANLHSDRLAADYNLLKTEMEGVDFARSRVAAAKSIQRSIEACDSDEIRKEIKAGIARYERKLAGG